MASKLITGAHRRLASPPPAASPLHSDRSERAGEAEDTLSFRSLDASPASSPSSFAVRPPPPIHDDGLAPPHLGKPLVASVASASTEASDSSTESGPSISDGSDSEAQRGGSRRCSATTDSEAVEAGQVQRLRGVFEPECAAKLDGRSAAHVRACSVATYTVDFLLRVRAALVIAGSCDLSLDPARLRCGPRPVDSGAAAGGGTGQAAKAASRGAKGSRGGGSAGGAASNRSAIAPSATSWAAAQQLRRRKAASASTMGSDEFARKVRGSLNKLTVERFDVLYEQLAGAGAQTPQHVAVLVQEIFEKATSQHKFIAMYADLCGRLEEDERIITAAMTGPSAETDSFRRILLNQCQASFEEMLTGSREWGTECYEAEVVAEIRSRVKQRNLGNVKLIGHFLVGGLLSSKLLITLCNELLEHRASCQDALECLAAMLTVVGATFDADATWPSRPAFVAVFERVEGLIAAQDVPPRMRFLFRDLLELREARWVDSKMVTAQAKGPARLEEVRVEATDKAPGATKEKALLLRPRAATAPAWAPPAAAASAVALKAAAGTQSNKARGGGKSGATAAVAPSPTASKLLAPPEASPATAAAVARAPALAPAPHKIAPVVPTSQASESEAAPFSRTTFHRELWQALRNLAKDGDVERAAQVIDRHRVPAAQQASEFTDLITRAVEETVQATRRSYFALAARIAARSHAFAQEACLEGIENFFLDVFDNLSEEVKGLAALVTSELVPALRAVLPRAQVVEVVPPDLRC